VTAIPETALQVRAARNQSLFRDYNELLEPSNERRLATSASLADWFCECAHESCSRTVQLTLAEYESVREDPTHFLVAPDRDHVVEDAEEVVLRHERYWIVEKIGAAGAVSEDYDPRSPGTIS
jgi:hypothetical protein